MPLMVVWLFLHFRQRDELIPKINKRHRVTFATKREFQELAIEFQRLVDVTYFERDMVDTNRAPS